MNNGYWSNNPLIEHTSIGITAAAYMGIILSSPLATTVGVVASAPAHPVMLSVCGWTVVVMMTGPAIYSMYKMTTDAYARKYRD